MQKATFILFSCLYEEGLYLQKSLTLQFESVASILYHLQMKEKTIIYPYADKSLFQ